MLEGTNYHLEVGGRIATLYITGSMPQPSLLLTACAALPPGVEILSVNLDGVARVQEPELASLDALRTHWESARRGPFRVAFSLVSKPAARTYRIRIGA